MADTYINDEGYRCFEDSGIPVHRWVYEKTSGRKIPKGHDVHHIDGNKLNNDPSNLEGMRHNDHFDLHERKWGQDDSDSIGPAVAALVAIGVVAVGCLLDWLFRKR